MKNKLFRIVALFMTVVTLGCMTGCSEDDTSDKLPSITISNVQQTSLTELTFTLNPKDASSYGYACPTLEDYKAKKYTFTKVDGGEKKTFTVGDLVASSSYVIVAVAYNGANTSEEVFTRVSTPTEAPKLSLLKRSTEDNTATFTLKTSENATKIMYTTYIPIEGENPDDTESRKQWKETTEIVPAGTVIKIVDLATAPYVFEAYAMAKTVKGDLLTDSFAISITSRPYVDFIMSDLTHMDGHIDLKKNGKCAKYYAGLAMKEEYTFTSVLAKLASPEAASYLIEDNYTGSMKAKLHFLSGAWMAEAPMTLWIVPCNDKGEYSTNAEDNIKFNFFSNYAYAAPTAPDAASVEVVASDITKTSYVLDLTATRCASYYILYGPKVKYEGVGEKTLIQEQMLTTAAQTDLKQHFKFDNLKPNTDYVFYAVGLDAKGFIGALTTKIVRTESLDYSSSASYTYTCEPKAESATVTFVPNAECSSVLYVCMTVDAFTRDYSGLREDLKNALAMDMSKVKNAQKHIFTADPTSHKVTLTGLESDETYLFFALAMDKDGKYGTMLKEIAVKTTKFDMTGTATAALTGFRFVNDKASFTITPDENCTDCYVLIYNKVLSSNEMVKTILARQTAVADPITVRMYDRFEEGFVPAQKFRNVFVPTLIKPGELDVRAIYVLCKGKDGKFNDPNATKKLLK